MSNNQQNMMLNRLKAALAEQGKTNRWLSEQLGKSENTVSRWWGYSLWQNFTNVINKAKDSCINVGQSLSDHFIDVNKVIELGSGALRNVDVRTLITSTKE